MPVAAAVSTCTETNCVNCWMRPEAGFTQFLSNKCTEMLNAIFAEVGRINLLIVRKSGNKDSFFIRSISNLVSLDLLYADSVARLLLRSRSKYVSS